MLSYLVLLNLIIVCFVSCIIVWCYLVGFYMQELAYNHSTY